MPLDVSRREAKGRQSEGADSVKGRKVKYCRKGTQGRLASGSKKLVLVHRARGSPKVIGWEKRLRRRRYE